MPKIRRPANDPAEQLTKRTGVVQRYKPDARECALLLLALMRDKEDESGKEVSRFRIAEISLKRLWSRSRITPELIEDVVEWLVGSGVTLFYTGSTYAVILTSTVESWTRVTSKRMNDKLTSVAEGTFDFSSLEHLLASPMARSEE